MKEELESAIDLISERFGDTLKQEKKEEEESREVQKSDKEYQMKIVAYLMGFNRPVNFKESQELA